MTLTRKSGFLMAVLAPLALAACAETTEVVLPDAEVITDPSDTCGAAAISNMWARNRPRSRCRRGRCSATIAAAIRLPWIWPRRGSTSNMTAAARW